MSLLDKPLHQLIHDTDLAALSEEIRHLESIDESAAHVLDRVHGARTLAVLRTPNDREGLAALSAHLELATVTKREKQLARFPVPYAARWRAWRDLLEALIESRDGLAAGELPRLKHVRELIAAIESEGELPQSQLAQRLGLGKANLTRLLNILEANLLIERRRVGRENMVGLSSAYRAHDESRKALAAPSPPAGSKYGDCSRPRLTLVQGTATRMAA